MSSASPLAAGEGRVIPLAARRGRRGLRSPRVLKAVAVLALCLLGLIGNFADSAVARTGLLLVDPPYPGGGGENVTATLVWAMIANLAVCAGVVMVAYWLLSGPSAQVVELRSRQRKR